MHSKCDVRLSPINLARDIAWYSLTAGDSGRDWACLKAGWRARGGPKRGRCAALLYEEGKLVPRDPERAKELYKKAGF